MAISGIRIYWFEEGDGRRPEERIAAAAADLTGGPAAVSEWEIRRETRGKPYFKRHPELFLSITHSGEYWVCALSDMQVGVDLQMHTLREGETEESAGLRCANLAKRFFHEKEADYVLEKLPYQRFFRVWAAKESYVKYTGKGIDDGFGAFSVIPGHEGSLPEYPSGDRLAAWTAAGAWFAESLVGGIKKQAYTFCVCGERQGEISEIKI